MSADPVSFVGSVPELYDRHMGPVFFTPYAADLAARVDPARLPLFELASGTGRLTAPLLDCIDGAPLTALDLNFAMQRVARSRISDRRARWVTGDALALPFNDRSFAQAVCQFGVMFFPDKGQGYRQAHRVLKPGGQFFFNVWDRIAENEFAGVVSQALASLFPQDPPDFMARIPHGYFDVESTIKSALSTRR